MKVPEIINAVNILIFINKAVTDFLFLGSKITGDGDCSHEIKRRLLFGRKAMTNLGSVLESKELQSFLMKVRVKKLA